ncbi:MAG: lysine 2,3-aminomutase [Candidatus Omnitrophica bacterium]|nr:lysine 2,3-aminomutase [Candidatus Omnitrophota bacterium]
MRHENKKRIKSRISRGKKTRITDWGNYSWQLEHTVTDIDLFEQITDIHFEPKERKRLQRTLSKFPLAVTPYYASLIDTGNYRNDPIFKQAFPDSRELDIAEDDMSDPLSEDKDSPAPGITHRYPDRILFNVTNACSMYCRHCTRKRKVGDTDVYLDKKHLLKGIRYIKNTTGIRDVLISGGDPLMLSDELIDWILDKVSAISHVQVIRIGTRMPAVLPYRVTERLVRVFRKHKNLWVNTHFNHPRELTRPAREALSKLADAGIPLGNQTVLLAGVNDCSRIIKNLMHKLVANRVRPYYLYQCDMSEGLTHFRTPVGKGMEIMENMIGHTSGFAVPRYVIDAPGGGGKIPVMPEYLISWSTNKVILRNYEGVITTYKEPDSYEPVFCDRNCEECTLQLNLDGAEEEKAIGIIKLFRDKEKTISLTPQDNERIGRRKDR